MKNSDQRGLWNIWNIIKERRLEAYGNQGILYLRRDEDGVVQEKYFRSLESFEKNYKSIRERNETGMFIDLSDKK